MPGKIRLTLEVPEDAADGEHSTGLTDEAYSELIDALADVGFGIVSGPDPVSG